MMIVAPGRTHIAGLKGTIAGAAAMNMTAGLIMIDVVRSPITDAATTAGHRVTTTTGGLRRATEMAGGGVKFRSQDKTQEDG